MRIDKANRTWLVVSVVALAAAGVAYGYAVSKVGRANYSGGGAVGLTLGVVATVLALVAVARGFRRWVRPLNTLAFGRAHAWLGFLVLPLAWMHGGFRHGGTLTCVTMWLLYVIVISGLLGALLRHWTSRPVTNLIPEDALDEPLEESLKRLAAEAEDVVALCGPADGNGDSLEEWRNRRIQAIKARDAVEAGRRDAMLTAVANAPAARSEAIKELYAMSIRPYIERGVGHEIMDSRVRAGQLMRRCRTLVPDELKGAVIELERICDDARRLRLRHRLQRYVDMWMLIHSPLSAAFIILVLIHGIGALRYL